MKIVLSDSQGKVFTTVNSFEYANMAAKALFKKQYWSDLYYDIQFNEDIQTAGSIDLEPASFHKPHQKTIFTTHLQTFWGNVSRSKVLPYLSQEDIDFCKVLLTFLPEPVSEPIIFD